MRAVIANGEFEGSSSTEIGGVTCVMPIDARLINFIANAIAVVAVGAMLLAGVYWGINRPYFKIQQIELAAADVEDDSLRYVTPRTVGATAAGRLKGNFFTVNLDEVRALIETAPWVRRAQVKRVWPNALLVQIEEQQPLAYWNEAEMINTWGEAFVANTAVLADDLVLPRLKGPASSERLVVQRYAELARWVAPLNLTIAEVTLSPRYAWEVELSDGLRLSLGRDPAADIADLHGRSGALPFAERMERFVQAWPRVTEALNQNTALQEHAVASADLRYTDGFAITLAPKPITVVKP